ncbi:Piso0_002870 [Millerozyma farinosa CBS 7064]|uniref:Piso0_002870 protein n=1 Tax=Pichia sorbitophila (strain ATCC MYA-4447 / BCRC 22081 / CBS 7064 / NBRC 10061 / NRRL Y-12695) TaxID=559304 RepID=G8YDR3_PICSO|nr:Piso0_002870 [Millerozyma farinosa CBS 7064]
MPPAEEIISEDFGFRLCTESSGFSVFDDPIAFDETENEDLHLLAIGNLNGYFACSNKTTLVLDKISKLSEVKDNQAPTLNRLEGFTNITQVRFNCDESMLYILEKNDIKVITINHKHFGDSQTQKSVEAYSIDSDPVEIKQIMPSPSRPSELAILTTKNEFCLVDNGSIRTRIPDVSAFSWPCSGKEIYISKYGENKLRSYSNETLSEISVIDFSSIANADEKQVAYISELRQDVVLLFLQSKEEDDNESFCYILRKNVSSNVILEADVAPSFSSVVRANTCYIENLVGWNPDRTITLVTAALATDVNTIFVDNQKTVNVVSQLNDSDASHFPIDEESGDDISPVGFALDLTNVHTEVIEPCNGVDKAVGVLPKLWTLSHEGKLIAWWVFDSEGLKTSKVSLLECTQLLKSSIDYTANYDGNSIGNSEGNDESDQISTKIDLSGLSIDHSNETSETFPNKVKSADSEQSDSQHKASNNFLEGSTSSQVGTESGKPKESSASATEGNLHVSAGDTKGSGFGTSGFGNSGFGNSGFGNSGFGNSGTESSGFGKSGFGSSGFDISGVGKSSFGNSDIGNTGTNNSGFGSSGFGSSGFGSSGFGKSSFGNSDIGNTGTNNSGFGSSGFGSSGFGKSGFGKSGFGNSGFGNSGFGNSGFGNSGFGNSGFGNSGFGNSGFGQSSFGNLINQNKNSHKSQVDLSTSKSDDSSKRGSESIFSKYSNTSTSKESNKGVSPFSNILNAEEKANKSIFDTEETQTKNLKQSTDTSNPPALNINDKKDSGVFNKISPVDDHQQALDTDEGGDDEREDQSLEDNEPQSNIHSPSSETQDEYESIKDASSSKNPVGEPEVSSDLFSDRLNMSTHGNSDNEKFNLRSPDTKILSVEENNENNSSQPTNLDLPDASAPKYDKTETQSSEPIGSSSATAVNEAQETEEVVDEKPLETKAEDILTDRIQLRLFDGFSGDLPQHTDPIENKIEHAHAFTQGYLKTLESNVSLFREYIERYQDYHLTTLLDERIDDNPKMQFSSKNSLVKEMTAEFSKHLEGKQTMHCKLLNMIDDLQNLQSERIRLEKLMAKLSYQSNKLKAISLIDRPLDLQNEQLRKNLRKKVSHVQNLYSDLSSNLMYLKAKFKTNYDLNSLEAVIFQIYDTLRSYMRELSVLSSKVTSADKCSDVIDQLNDLEITYSKEIPFPWRLAESMKSQDMKPKKATIQEII